MGPEQEVTIESIDQSFRELQLLEAEAATAGATTSNGVWNGRTVIKKEYCQEEDLTQLFLESNAKIPQDIVNIITDYAGFSMAAQLAAIEQNPSRLDNSFKEYFMNVLRDTPEKITKEIIIQLCQLLRKQPLPAKNEYDNIINCQLLTNLIKQIKLFKFFSLEEMIVTSVYHRQMPKNTAFSWKAGQMNEELVRRESCLPLSVIYYVLKSLEWPPECIEPPPL